MYYLRQRASALLSGRLYQVPIQALLQPALPHRKMLVEGIRDRPAGIAYRCHVAGERRITMEPITNFCGACERHLFDRPILVLLIAISFGSVADGDRCPLCSRRQILGTDRAVRCTPLQC